MKSILSLLICCFYFIWLLLLNANVHQTAWWEWAEEIYWILSRTCARTVRYWCPPYQHHSLQFFAQIQFDCSPPFHLCSIALAFPTLCWHVGDLSSFERRAKMPLTTSEILWVVVNCCSRVGAFMMVKSIESFSLWGYASTLTVVLMLLATTDRIPNRTLIYLSRQNKISNDN